MYGRVSVLVGDQMGLCKIYGRQIQSRFNGTCRSCTFGQENYYYYIHLGSAWEFYLGLNLLI